MTWKHQTNYFIKNLISKIDSNYRHKKNWFLHSTHLMSLFSLSFFVMPKVFGIFPFYRNWMNSLFFIIKKIANFKVKLFYHYCCLVFQNLYPKISINLVIWANKKRLLIMTMLRLILFARFLIDIKDFFYIKKFKLLICELCHVWIVLLQDLLKFSLGYHD